MLGSSGFAVADGQELVRATLYGEARLREMKFVPPRGRDAACVLKPASLAMVYPSGYHDEFYVREGRLVYGAEENWSPPAAADVFAQWVAESLDRS